MRVLLVDDESHVRSSMAKMISETLPHYIIEEANDGEDALQLLEQTSFDLVITDLRMPAVNGLELSKAIYERWHDTAIIMLTGYAEFEYAQTALRYGVKEYLLKPASAEQIHEAIARVAMTHSTHQKTKEVDKHRTQLLMEKRVQDLFYELPLPYYDESLFCPFDKIALFSFVAKPSDRLEKATRFAIKNVVEDVLQQYGTLVVVVGDQAITAVLFIGEGVQVSEAELQSMIEKVINIAKQTIKIDLLSSYGGTTTTLNELSSLYEQSLKPIIQSESIEQIDNKEDKEQVHHSVREALAIIRERFAADISLTSIATELFVSPNYLSGLFKAETGSTFTHHLTAVRMEHAKQLLKTTNKKIYQICEAVGYGDQAHFSRMFKALEGMSPYEYRSKTNN